MCPSEPHLKKNLGFANLPVSVSQKPLGDCDGGIFESLEIQSISCQSFTQHIITVNEFLKRVTYRVAGFPYPVTCKKKSFYYTVHITTTRQT